MEEGLLKVAALPMPFTEGAAQAPVPDRVSTDQTNPTSEKVPSSVLVAFAGQACVQAQGKGLPPKGQ